MSDCREVADRLASYVDDLLTEDERDRLEHHLSACPPCRRLADDERTGRTVLRRHAPQLLTEPLPPGLRARCQAVASTAGLSERLAALGPWWRVRLVPVLLAVVAIVFVASAFFALATRRSDGVLAAQLTADHSKCFRLFGPPAGTSVDASQVERMFSEQYGWNLHVPSSSDSDDIQLVSARRCLYGDGRIPHVMYRVHGQDVSLFVLNGAERDAADFVAFGHRLRIWSRDGSSYVLVTPVGAGDMAEAARYVMREAR